MPPRQVTDGERATAASAQNPWYCGTEEPLRRRQRDRGGEPIARDGILRLLARRLHDWPDDTPLRLHPEAERLRRLLDTVAGYPEITAGSLPFDQPFRTEAAEALELALALDGWAPLAGRHGLRAELLWLDRVQRSGLAVTGLELQPGHWLQLVTAWLLGGLAAPDAIEPDADVVLLDLLYDPEERPHAGGAIRGAAELLTAAALGRRHPELAKPSPDPRHDKQRLGAVAEWLWWCRLGTPLAPDDPRPAPRLGLDDGRATVEVTFHRIQAWMTSVPGGTEQTQAEPRLTRLYGAMVRGASDLLEATTSALRSALLARLGPGALLVDGGARLCFRCPADDRADVEAAIHRTIDDLLAPHGGLGRRYAGILALLARDGLLRGDGDSPEAREERRRLAWSALPALSVTFVERGEDDGGAGPTGPVRVPVRRRWPMPVLAAAPGPPDRDSRREYRMCLPARLRVEVGVLMPRDRLLRVRFRDATDRVDLQKLPSVRTAFRQLLVADLNRVGALLARARDPRLDAEATARRSFRFTALWLTAVARTVVAFDHSNLPEVLVLGGDDLVVGTRLDDANLLAFTERLHAELAAFNAELPPCDGVSFSAGLVTVGGRRTSSQRSLEAAYRLKERAKRRWRSEIEPDDISDETAVQLAGDGPRRSSLVLCAPASEPQPGDGVSSDEVSRVLDLGRAVAAARGPFSALVESVRAGAPDVLRGGDPPRRFEVVAQDDRVSVVEYVAWPRPRALLSVTPCPPCTGNGAWPSAADVASDHRHADDFADVTFVVSTSAVDERPRPVIGVDGPVAGADPCFDHHATGESVNLLAIPDHVPRPRTIATTMLDGDAVLSAALVLLRSNGEDAAVTAAWPTLFEAAHFCDHLLPSGRYPEAERAGLGLYCWLKDKGFALADVLAWTRGERRPGPDGGDRAAPSEATRSEVFRALTLATVRAIRDGALPFDLAYLDRLDRMEADARAAIRDVADGVTVLAPSGYVDPLAVYRVVTTDVALIVSPRADGTTNYHLGVHPRAYGRVDLRPALAALRAREPGWGGRANTGGSPLGSGSRLSVAAVLDALTAPGR